MSSIQIVIHVQGSQVRQVYCSAENAVVTLVDSTDESTDDVFSATGPRVECFPPDPLDALAGTAIERAIDAAAFSEV